MERLTGRDNFGNATIKGMEHALREALDNMCDEDVQTMQEALDRLAYYEDSGITPQKAETIAAALRSKRFLVLPCKIGTTLYRVVRNPPRHKGYRGANFIRAVELTWNNLYEVVCEDKMGKSIFLKREDAEAALAKLAEEQQ